MPRPCSRITDPVGYRVQTCNTPGAEKSAPGFFFLYDFQMLGISLVEAEKDHIRSHSLVFMLLSAGFFTNYIIEQGKGLDYSIFSLIDQGRQNEEFTDQTFKISVRCAWIYNMI